MSELRRARGPAVTARAPSVRWYAPAPGRPCTCRQTSS